MSPAAPSSPQVLTVGRIGVDLYPEQTGVPLSAVTTFAQSLGGTATNVAVGATRLGHRAAVLTKVGPDEFGTYARQALEGFGVDTTYVGTAEELLTPVVFCALDPPEDPPLLFYRLPVAPDLTLTKDDVPWDLVRDVPVLWVTGTGVSTEPARQTQLDMLAHRGRPDAGRRALHRARPRLAADVLAVAGGRPPRVRADARARHRRGRQPGRGRGGGRHVRPRGGGPPAARPRGRAGPGQEGRRGGARRHP